MAVRKDKVQISIAFLTDESKQYAKLIQENRAFISDLQKAKRRGEDLTKTINQIALSGKKVEGLDLGKLAPSQLITRARQLKQVLQVIPQSAPQYKALEREYKAINDELAEMRQRTRGVSAAMSSLKSEGSSLGKVLTGAFAVFGGITFAGIADRMLEIGRRAIGVTSEFERLEAVLVNTLGDRGEALRALEQINDYAARTPFQVNEITDAYVKLSNRGLRPTLEDLTAMGDLAASQGKSFIQLTEAVLDATQGEFERLKEFGIRGSAAGDQVTLSFKNQEIQVKKNAEEIQKAIIGFGELQGVQGSTAAISETLAGKLSNLRDNIDRLLARMGDSVLGTIFKNTIDLINDMIGSNERASESVQSLQAQFNIEIETLKRGNLSQENRNELIDTINQKYKDYLPNLIEESDSISQIADKQQEANEAFAQRITLLAAEESLRDVQQARIEAKRQELDLQLRLTKAEQDYNDSLAGSSERASNSRQGVDQRFFQAEQNLKRVRFEVQENQKEQALLEEQFQATSKAAQELGLNLDEIFGKPKGGGGDGGSGGGGDEKEQKNEGEPTEVQSLLASLERIGEQSEKARIGEEERRKAYIDGILEGLVQEEEANMLYLESQGEFLEELRLLNMSDQEIELEQINAYYDRKLQLAEYYKVESTQIEEARQRELEEKREEFAKKQQDNEKKLSAFLKAIWENRYQVANAAIDGMIGLLSLDEKERKKHAKAIQKLETYKVLINLASEIQHIWKNANANPLNALIPGWGSIWAGIQSVLAGARANVAISKIKSTTFDRGGFTGQGYFQDETGHRVAGIVHNDEWVAPKWMTESYPDVFRSLEGVRLRGYNQGGFVTNNTTPSAYNVGTSTTDVGNANQAVVNEIRQLREDMQSGSNSVRAHVVYSDLEATSKEINSVRNQSQI